MTEKEKDDNMETHFEQQIKKILEDDSLSIKDKEIFIKAFKNGFYGFIYNSIAYGVIHKYTYEETKMIYWQEQKAIHVNTGFKDYDDFYLKNFGITWSLEKENLKNK